MSDKYGLNPTSTADGHMYIANLWIGNINTSVYQFVIDKSNGNTILIVKFLMMYVLELCVNLKSQASHMSYGWKFHNIILYLSCLWKINITAVWNIIQLSLPGELCKNRVFFIPIVSSTDYWIGFLGSFMMIYVNFLYLINLVVVHAS